MTVIPSTPALPPFSLTRLQARFRLRLSNMASSVTIRTSVLCGGAFPLASLGPVLPEVPDRFRRSPPSGLVRVSAFVGPQVASGHLLLLVSVLPGQPSPGTMTSADSSRQVLLRRSVGPASVRPPRVRTRSFPSCSRRIYTSCSGQYWTSSCIADSSAVECLMRFLFVGSRVCFGLLSACASRHSPCLRL